MMIDIFAFDECSILHLCEIKIPPAYLRFFSKEKLVYTNFSKLTQFKTKLDSQNTNKYRFHPLNLETNKIRFANELLRKEGNQVHWLGSALKVQIIEQLSDFVDNKIKDFKIIPKNDAIIEIKQIFIENKKELTKGRNIPEDDDLQIISGYIKFNSSGQKYLISGDEHFWGYKDLIKDNFNINIIKEWECHLIGC